MKNLPLQLIIKVESTNGTTMLDGLESVTKILHNYNFPRDNQIIKDKRFKCPYWKVTILKSVSSL